MNKFWPKGCCTKITENNNNNKKTTDSSEIQIKPKFAAKKLNVTFANQS